VSNEDEMRRHFDDQALGSDELGSPFMGRLCRLLARSLDAQTRTGRRILGWPGNMRADALSLRLCGGLHALVLAGADASLAAVYPPNSCDNDSLRDAVAGALRVHDERVCASLDNPPQTNEVARSAMLLPGYLAIARATGLPLAINEIGASAGLNLLFDRFHYRYGDASWGVAASPVRLSPHVRGALPLLTGDFAVASRAGCDIAPIDPVGGSLRLRSYIWPDQPLRMERLDGALQLAEREPPQVSAKPAERFVLERLAQRKHGEAFVLAHSIMWQYMPQTGQQEIAAALQKAGGEATHDAPVAWLRMEPAEAGDAWATLSLKLWPGGAVRRLARCDYHGRWIEVVDPAIAA